MPESPSNILPFLVLGLLAPILAGCMVGPDYRTPPLSMPAQWSAEQPQTTVVPADLAGWWKRLGDETLDGLVEEAVTGNLDVATAKASIREARASYREAHGALLPSVSGSGAVERSRTAAGGTSVAASTDNQFQAGFDASWEIDLFGANRRAAEAARYGIDAAEEELRSTLLTLIGDVASAYVEARGYQARMALSRRTAASQRETAELTRNKFRLGAVSQVDLSNAEGLAASTEAAVFELEASYRETVHRLSVLTGRPPETLMERMEASAAIPAPRLPIPTGIPADILLSRPDIRLAERQLAQYTARIGQAEAERYPSISLTGSISTSAASAGDLGRKSTIGWSFGPSLTVPLFNGGQLAAAVDVARAQRDRYFIAYRSAVLTALEDVENAIVALSRERLRADRLDESAKAYRNSATLSRTRYQFGASSFLDLLDAERSAYSAEESLIESRVSIATDYIALNKALGGGWDGVMDASEPEIIDTENGPQPVRTGSVPAAAGTP